VLGKLGRAAWPSLANLQELLPLHSDDESMRRPIQEVIEKIIL
jgi:hypothetical protein